MTETKQTSTTKTDRRPDCVTEITWATPSLPFPASSSRASATDRNRHDEEVLEAEAATQKRRTDHKKRNLTLLLLYRQPPHVVQSRYGIVGLAVEGSEGFYVKTDQPTTNYRPLPKTFP